MYNFSQAKITLRAEKDTPAQLMFFKVSKPLTKEQLYGTQPSDRFQHQTDPVPRKKGKPPSLGAGKHEICHDGQNRQTFNI